MNAQRITAVLGAVLLAATAACTAPDASTAPGAAQDSEVVSTADQPPAGSTTTSVALDPEPNDQTPRLDPETIRWFGTYCTKLSPLADLPNVAGHLASDSPDAGSVDERQRNFGSFLTRIEQAFNEASGELKQLPDPQVDDGARMASDVIAALDDIAPKVGGAATEFEAASVSDLDGLKDAVDTAVETVAAAVADTALTDGELAEVVLPEKIALPMCEPVYTVFDALVTRAGS